MNHLQGTHNKIASQDVAQGQYVRNSTAIALTAIIIPIPAGQYREIIATNRSNFDIELSFTTTLGGSGTHCIPAQGALGKSLRIDPDQGFFNMITVKTIAGAPYAGSVPALALLINFID